MKKIYLLFLILFAFTTSVTVAQSSHDKISYQSVVRDGSNHLLYDAQVTVAVSIKNSGDAAVKYSETHTVTSNANGLISFLIGAGNNQNGNWNAVQWNHADITLVTSVNGTVLSTHTYPLSAVPYALYAKNADTAIYADSVNLTVVQNFIQSSGYLTDELQVLSISNDTIYLSKGGWVKLPAGFSGDYNDLTNKPDLKPVATSGDYNDLVNKPTKSDLCDSVRECVTGWISDSTRMIFDTLHNHYATKNALRDTAEAIRGVISTEVTQLQNNIDTVSGNVRGALIDTAAAIREAIPTNVSELTNDAGYLTSFTEQQVLSISHDTIFLTGDSYVVLPKVSYNDLTNKPGKSTLCDSVSDCVHDWISDSTRMVFDTLHTYYATLSTLSDTAGNIRGALVDTAEAIRGDFPTVPTKVSAFENDVPYLKTESQILSISHDTIFLTGDSYVVLPKVSYNDLTNKPGKTVLCDSVSDCVHGWISDSTRMVFDTLHTYYVTKNLLKDTAAAIREDFPTVPTNVSEFTNDAGYITNAAIPTKVSAFENDVPYLKTESQILSISHDTIFLTGDSYVVLPKVNYNDLTNKPGKTVLCDSVSDCVHDWISDSTRMVFDTLHTYYATKNLLKDTAAAIREDFPTVPTNVSEFTNDAGYITNAAIPTKVSAFENDVPYLKTESQILSISHDTIFLTGNSYVVLPKVNYNDLTNKPGKTVLCDSVTDCVHDWISDSTRMVFDTLHTYYATKNLLKDTAAAIREDFPTIPTKVSAFENDVPYLKTESQILSISHDTIFLTGNSYVVLPKVNYNDLTNKPGKTVLCDSVTDCVHDWISDSTRMVIDSLGAYYDTTHVQTYVQNSIAQNVHDGKLAVITYGATKLDTLQKFTANQAGNDTINLSRYVIIDTLQDNYYTSAQVNTKLRDTANYVLKTAVRDSIASNVKLSSKNDSLFLKRGNAFDTVKLATPGTLITTTSTRLEPNSGESLSDTVNLHKISKTGSYEDLLHKPTIPDAANNATVNVNLNGSTVGSFTLNQADPADVNLQNIAITNVANTFSGNNKFTGVDTFTNKNIVEKRGFSFSGTDSTTNTNCGVMVNACDLLAVFDSLAKRMDNLSKRFDSLQKSNDSLAEELDSLKKSTMPSLALSSDKPSDTCVVEGSMVEITYKATLLRTDGTFNYKWYVNGTFLREGATKDTIHLNTDTAGVIKVKCVATATSGPTELKDSLTTTIGIKLVFDYTIFGGNSADFGRIRIDSSTAISAVWKDEDGNEIGTWNSGLTETLPVGEYTVVLSGGCEPDTVKIDVLASPMCLVGSLNETETIGSYTFNVEEGVTKYGRQYVTQIYDLEDNLYNVVDIGGVCWTRENMRSTIYSKNSKFYPIYDGLSDYTHGPNAPYLFEKSDPQINGYLYTKSAAAAGVYSYPTDYNAYIRGICPDGWHLPSYNDVSVMLDATGARSNAGKLAGALTSAADTSWTECNTVTSATGNYDYAERNSTGFSAIRSGYIDASYLDTEPFNDDGAYFWVSRQHDNTNYPTWYSFVLRIPDGCSKDIDFGEDAFASHIYNALSVRCVRDMQPSLSISSSEGNNVSSCGSLSVPVTFTAKIHNDDADGYQYSWNGAAATSSNTFSASYSSSGNYTVSCTATKGEMTFTATYKIKVGCVGIDTCIYNLTVTVVGTMGSPTTIDWGDGQTTNSVAVNSTFHTYGTAGTYNIQVSDNDGNIETLTATVSKPHTTCTVSNILANEAGSGSAIDSVSDHEGNWYEVVQIDQQCWLKENMRCTTSPSAPNKYIVYKPTSADDHKVIISYASKIAHWYNNDSTFYAPKDYGLLYNWCAAMDTFNVNYPEVATQSDTTGAWACTFDGHRRGICPAGWHVPTTQEWTVMESFVNGSALYPYHQAGEYRGTHAAKLSSSCDWNDMYADGHGSVDPKSPGDYSNPERNSSGFSALPAGTWNYLNGGEFTNGATASGRDGLYAMFWTSSNDIAPNDSVRLAVERKIMNAVTEVQAYNYAKYHGHSVRCVRD